MKNKILITGAKGQVGTELVLEANKRGYDVVGPASTELDITDAGQVRQALEGLSLCAVINAAAYTDVDGAEEHQNIAYSVNAEGVGNLAAVCKQLDIPLLHISTDYVFDGEKESPYLESDETKPTCVYGASKLEGEQALQNGWQKHIILRVSWVFGANGHNFVKTMLRLSESRDELSVVNDQYGAPTAAKSIASCLLNIVERSKFGAADFPWGVYHYQSEPGVTWYEFANEIFEQADAQGILNKQVKVNPVSSSEFSAPVIRPSNSKLSGKKIQRVFDQPADNWKNQLSEVFKVS